MRKLDLSGYIFGVDDLEEVKAKTFEALAQNDDVALVRLAGELSKGAIYDVKRSLIEILFHQDLELHADDIIGRQDLARKLRSCLNGEILLEEQEWIDLKHAIRTAPRLSLQDVEFIKRIYDAPTVEVEAKECKPLPAAPEPKTEE